MEFVDLKAQYRVIQAAVDARIRAVLEHGRFILGPEVKELEEKLANYTGARYAIACSSGTDALLVAMMALGIGPGDEVVTTPFTFIATAEMMVLLGAKPVFVDIDPETYNLDPGKLRAAITKKTKAIMPVSLYGLCADMDAIHQIAGGIPVIEDAAQSFGATYKGRRSCNLSTIGCTSFFPSKPLGAYGDGGACFTSDEALATRMRRIHDHGQEGRYEHRMIGINGRLDTLQAAVLLVKLEVLDEELKKRIAAAGSYSTHLGKSVKTPKTPPGYGCVFAQYTIEANDRDALQSRLTTKRIPTAVHYPMPLYLQPALAKLGLKEGSFPVAEAAAKRVLSLPMHPYLTEEQIETVAAAVLEAVEADGVSELGDASTAGLPGEKR